MAFSSDQRQAETDFAFKVDIAMPAGGSASRLYEMRGWCIGQAGTQPWACFPQREGGQELMRFYFASEEVAARFRRRWGGIARQYQRKGRPVT